MARAQKVGLSLNAAEAAYLGSIDIEAQYALAQNWSVSAGGTYNPWSWGKGTEVERNRRRRDFSLGARWWPWHVYSGWWVSGGAMWQEYNEANILFSKDNTSEEGDRLGLRLGAGYTYMVNSWLNIDFGIRGFGGNTRYVTYECPTCGKVLDRGDKFFIMPDEAVLSLMFVF